MHIYPSYMLYKYVYNKPSKNLYEYLYEKQSIENEWCIWYNFSAFTSFCQTVQMTNLEMHSDFPDQK